MCGRSRSMDINISINLNVSISMDADDLYLSAQPLSRASRQEQTCTPHLQKKGSVSASVREHWRNMPSPMTVALGVP